LIRRNINRRFALRFAFSDKGVAGRHATGLILRVALGDSLLLSVEFAAALRLTKTGTSFWFFFQKERLHFSWQRGRRLALRSTHATLAREFAGQFAGNGGDPAAPCANCYA
jgi:hypothetical protein